jgi:hypothetical protein
LSRNNKTGFIGVSESRNRSKTFQARIKTNDKDLWLGTYPTKEEAAAVYDRAAIEHFGPDARVNFKAG